MSANLMAANRQWATRPSDQRFMTIDEMISDATEQRGRMHEQTVKASRLRFRADGSEGLVMDGLAAPVALNNFAAKQFISGRLGYMPSAVQGRLSGATAAIVLNEQLDHHVDPESEIQFLIENCPELNIAHSATSGKYKRVWDEEILPYFKLLERAGYRPPPTRPVHDGQAGTRKARADEVGMWGNAGVQIKEGDDIAPGNLYRSDRDMFVFMANPNSATDDGGGNSLLRGVIGYNSQVGDRSCGLMSFAMQSVCGNAIIWGVQDIVSFKFKHMGEVRSRVIESLTKFVDAPAQTWDRELRVIDRMRANKIGSTREMVTDNVYNMRLDNALTQKVITAAYDNAARHEDHDGDPNSWYGMVNAITRFSQTLPNTNSRLTLDTAAGKMFDLAEKCLA